MDAVLDIALLVLMGVTALAIIRLRNLFGAVMLARIYSLLSAGLLVDLDAVDEAFTEAAVGAGISTVLFLQSRAMLESAKAKIERVGDLCVRLNGRGAG